MKPSTEGMWALLVDAYNRNGKQGVLDVCAEHGITATARCEQCEDTTPVFDACCAICGTQLPATALVNIEAPASFDHLLLKLPQALRTELGEFVEGGANRLDDTLLNPLETQCYSAEELVAMKSKRDRGFRLRDLLFTPDGV